MKAKRIAIFVDGPNFTASLRCAGYFMNYDALLAHYNTKGRVIEACYFTGLPPKDEHAVIRPLIDRLSHNGWSVITKETKDLITPTGLFRTKGNMDVEITVRAMQLPDETTDFILCSGDGDFRYLVEVLQQDGVRVTAISHHSFNPDRNQLGEELRKQVDEFIDLKTVRDRFALTHPDPSIDHAARRRRDFLNGT